MGDKNKNYTKMLYKLKFFFSLRKSYHNFVKNFYFKSEYEYLIGYLKDAVPLQFRQLVCGLTLGIQTLIARILSPAPPLKGFRTDTDNIARG